MAKILSGLLVEEVARELLEEVSLRETLPVILIAVDVSVEVVVELLSSLLFLAQEMKVRLKRDMRIMYKIFFIFTSIPKVKLYCLFQENQKYNTNRFVLQEMGSLLGGVSDL